MAGAASQAGDTDSSRAPGLTSGLQGPLMSTVVLYCWCHSDSASVFLYFTTHPHLFKQSPSRSVKALQRKMGKLHSIYVLAPVDKAANNVIII